MRPRSVKPETIITLCMDSKVSRLLSAAEQGNVLFVTDLLEKGHHVDWSDEEGVNALHSAAANGNENVVRLLLSRGASLEARTIYGWTALMLASYYGHFMVCWILLQHKSNIHAKSDLGSTALDCAARNGYVQIVALLIEAGGQQVRDSGTKAAELSLNKALMTAAQHGQEAALKLLLEKGAEVNHREESTGWTSLMLAAVNGHMTAAQILVHFGADTNALNIIDQTALEVAVVRQKTDVQGFLDERTSTRPQIKGQKFVRPSIIEAATDGNVALVRELLDQGDVDKNSTDEDGATPLMYAAMRGHLSVVQLLIDRGVDVDKQDEASGWTALMQATFYGFKDVAKLLIKSGADVNIQGNNGCRAFDIGSIIGNTEIVRLLASVSMQLPSTPKSYYKCKKPSSVPSGKESIADSICPIGKSEKEISKIDSDFLESHGGKRWWSQLSRIFRNLNVTFKMQSNNKIQVMHLSKSLEEPGVQENTGEKLSLPDTSKRSVSTSTGVTSRSLASVITDSPLKHSGGYRPQSLALVSHVTKLPDDVITPVVPPPLPSSSFELPSMQRRQHNDNLEEVSRPQYPSNISSNSSVLPSVSWAHKKGGKMGSPESSYSTASFPSSASNNSGSRTLRQDTAFNLMSAMSSSLWHKANPPSLVPIQSPPAEHQSLQKGSSNSSLPGHVDDTHRHRYRSPCLKDTYCYKTSLDYSEDDLENILKKLSLEKYQSIFEEQEVDMEAFLTLNDSDLSELGVTQKDARQQILTAIAELNSGKDRQRQHQHEALSNYRSRKSPGTSGYVSPSTRSNLPHWPLK
ncbi:ankyrin repeat and SAM domain-containing protein 6-like isoform X2 [Montipora capricornis]|uniref:ankyrin repeat and SAM domain-containing protein 6-like isoform X1 n=1 Tax=Montipora foliosa TaxID=591990 RepID=UPI0035F13F70